MDKRTYKSGDVVWVMAGKRLGWWPGQVQNVEKLRQDLAADVTDKTIAVVKYLNEDNYQFVEDKTIICAYNADQKEEYISLGMKKYHEKKRLNETSSTFMKFPNDVRHAEKLVGGNPDIVDKEQFQPKKAVPAQSKYKDIFVDPKAKEAKAKSPVKGALSPRRPGRPPAAKDNSPAAKVNHPRFKGQSDHEVRIRRQEKSPVSGSSGSGEYKCDSCAFQTARLNVMVLHQKMHLSNPSGGNQQKAAQKRPSSPPKKAHSKRSKKTAEPDGDLFDQVKRTLEAKETGAKVSPQSKTTSKINTSPKTPKTPKAPRTPRVSKTPATAAVAKTPTVKASETKTQLNPKKKWLKSLQKEANPEVKNKLMADWEEDEEEEKQQQQRTEVTEVKESNEASVESDSDHDHRPSKSNLLHERSDDEEDDAMDTDTTTNANSLDRPNTNGQECAEDSLAGISAEIDKLNADLDARSREARNATLVPEPINGLSSEDSTVVNGNGPLTEEKPSTKCDEEIKQNVASLLAETSVPSLPDIGELSKVTKKEEVPPPPVEEPKPVEEKKPEVTAVLVESSKAESATTENGVDSVVQNGVAVAVAENGVESEVDTANGGSNILMQVEGGETYMVVWEPGSNIQEFLACGGEGEDGSAGTTQTLLIDPSSLQAGSDLENLFQMAVAASAANPQQNEQSNPTMTSPRKEDRRSAKSTPVKGKKSKQTAAADELLQKHGTAFHQELAPNTLVWALVNSRLFVPAAVIDSSNCKTLILASFDVERPNNRRKYARNRVIVSFHHEVNLELLTFSRARNKATISTKLDRSYEHARSFAELREKDNFLHLTVTQYLVACHRSPVKLFSERYLTVSPVDEIPNLPELWDDSDLSDEPINDEEESSKRLETVEAILEQHVLTESCITHLMDFVSTPSERLSLYNSQCWIQLTRSATSGILEKSHKLYSKLADFLFTNVHRVRQLEEGKDHKRAFVLDLLLPEALIYGVQKTFQITPQEAHKMVIYGLKESDKPSN